MRIYIATCCTLIFSLGLASAGDLAREAEAERIKVINKVKPAVVAVYMRGGAGGGSGVIIDPEGYALTNFHVVQPTGPTMVCGLPDGILYDAVLVGLDKVGDVALIKLIAKEKGKPFPFAELGNSDKTKVGDWSLAMGNPFLLATDFSPSVSFGLVSGVNRYQYPSGGLLEYTDCIQFDTTINPGNSGGPLFNMQGQLIGINGRGSFAQEKRFRINCGVGYAISINQIKNFLGHLRAGIDTDHATLGALVGSASEESELSKIIVKQILDDSDAHRRDVQEGDHLLYFAGRPLSSTNQYKNILGIYPKGWRMPLTYERGNELHTTLVRLMPNLPSIKKGQPEGAPQGPQAPAPTPQGDGKKFYKAKKGFANYYFNEEAQKRIMEGFKKYGDFSTLTGNWLWDGTIDREGRVSPFTLSVEEKDAKPLIKFNMSAEYSVEPGNKELTDEKRMTPPYSGGLLMAMYHYRRFLTMGVKGFEEFSAGGVEPVYVQPLVQGKDPIPFEKIRLMADVLHTEHSAVEGKWYFYRADLNPQFANKHPYPDYALIGFEITVAVQQNPCEVYLHEYKEVDGRQEPGKMEVRNGDKRYGVLTIKDQKMEKGK